MRRRWLPLSIAALGFVAAASAGVFHTQRVAAERDRAQLEARTAESVSDFLVGVFLASDPDQFEGREPTALELLDVGAERVREELQDDPAVRARILDVLGEVPRFRCTSPSHSPTVR